MKPGDSDFRNEAMGQVVNDCKLGDKSGGSKSRRSRMENGVIDSEGNKIVQSSSRASVQKLHVLAFDDCMTNGKAKATGFEGSSLVGYGYEMGDMIWGKVKSHPWWPGFIYNDSFALPSVRRTKREGHVLVAFFGDSSYGWFEPAELIPFETNFSEKSCKTNSRTFGKAVEEAIVEVSRRSALGLSCHCRNPCNFRPTNAQGYFSVNLNNFEVGGVYSIGQIMKARASFQPRETVAFMKQLALMTRDEVYNSMHFIKNRAIVLAYRKAVFEEFDETYAEAFGQQPVPPSRESLEAVAHPARVPLSGPMVVAEALGDRKRKSTKPHKSKEQESKEKSLLEKRDEPTEFKIHQTEQKTFSGQPSYVEESAALSVRDGNISEPSFTFAESCQTPNSSFDDSRKGPQLESKVDDADTNVKHDPKRETTSVLVEAGNHVSPKIDPNVGVQDPIVHVHTGNKKAKLLKRFVGELSVEKSAQGEKETKKRKTESDSIGKQSTFGTGDIDHTLLQLLGDLQALALNPFHGVHSNTPSTVQNAFVKFRSAVFEKSFLPAETESNEEANAELPPHEDLPSPNQPETLIITDDPVKTHRKRDPPDHQEETGLKRLKKAEDLKKSAQKNPETVAIILKPDSTKKTRTRSPTMLVMKFPLNTNIPSVPELKARLARFGPLDHSATRVFWQTFTCRVVYLYKADAEAAHKHFLESNSLFGNVNVRSSIRALGGAAVPELESKREDVEQKPPKPPQSAAIQLKSCLKKVADEEPTAAAVTSGPRVKFVLESNNTSSFGDGGGKCSSSSSSHLMEFNSRNFQKGILPLPPTTEKLPNTSNNMGYGEAPPPPPPPPRNSHAFNANMGRVGPSPTNIDITQEMLSLLTKCNDLVTHVSNFLGYVPYHPL